MVIHEARHLLSITCEAAKDAVWLYFEPFADAYAYRRIVSGAQPGRPRSNRLGLASLIVLDTVAIVGAQATMLFLAYRLTPTPGSAPLNWRTLGPFALGLPIMLLCMMAVGLYRLRGDRTYGRDFIDIARATGFGWGILTISLLLIERSFFNRPDAMYWTILYPVMLGFALSVERFAVRALLHRIYAHGWRLRHVAIIGTGRLGQLVYHTLRRNSWTGINPVFFISHHETTSRRRCLDLPVKGGLADFEAILDAAGITGVFIALPGRLAAALPDLIMRLERYPLDVRVVPDTNPKYLPINMSANELDGMPVLSVRESPLSGWGRITKRGVDIVVGGLLLLAFALPMLVIALLVRLSGPGPVIFRQERMSLNGQRFKIFKFRTMEHVDVERPSLRDLGRGTDAWTRPDDPRITRTGKFLRRTSLDELPQLLNVLLGEMSLVGPRPERPELIEQFRENWRGYMLRQNVKAGITGWAQVNGLRGDTSLRKRLQYDLSYIRNWSILFDLRILARFLAHGLRNLGSVWLSEGNLRSGGRTTP